MRTHEQLLCVLEAKKKKNKSHSSFSLLGAWEEISAGCAGVWVIISAERKRGERHSLSRRHCLWQQCSKEIPDGLRAAASIKRQEKDSRMVHVYAMAVLRKHRSAQLLHCRIVSDQSASHCWAGTQTKVNVWIIMSVFPLWSCFWNGRWNGRVQRLAKKKQKKKKRF